MSADSTQLERLESELKALLGSHRHDLISDVATRILALSPRNGNALYMLALAQYGKAQQTGADDDFAKMKDTIEWALSTYSSVSEFHYLLYYYYLWYGGAQYILARDCLREAIRLSPQNAEYFRQLGEVYLINRDTKQAVTYLSKAVELNPIQAEYRSRLALALLRDQKVQAAVTMAEQALHDAPNDMTLLDTVGMIYILLGDLDKADAFFRDAMRLDPTYSYFQKHMDWIRREQKDMQQRQSQGRKYTPLYIRQKQSLRFFKEIDDETYPIENNR